jgi:hypothetical protein
MQSMLVLIQSHFNLYFCCTLSYPRANLMLLFLCRQFKMLRRQGDDLSAIALNIIKMAGGDEHLPSAAEGMDDQGIGFFINQAPVWNESEQMYTLDFKSRVTVASVKNFLLERPVRENLETHGSSTTTNKERGIDDAEKKLEDIENKKPAPVPEARETVMIFGRTGYEPDQYTLDFRFPFSPLQAFMCALSSVDSHLICE